MRSSHFNALLVALTLPVAAFAQTPVAPAAAPAAPMAAPVAAPVAAPAATPVAAAGVNTVAGALKAAKDTKVVLEGQLVRKIDAQNFEFKDATGMMKVEIDKKHQPAKGLEANAKVKLTGEVEVKKSDVKIDVKKVDVLS